VVNILTTRVIERSQVVPGSFGGVDQRILAKSFFAPPYPFQGSLRRNSPGTGFIIAPDGFILSNDHVIKNAAKIVVKFSNGKEIKQSWQARIWRRKNKRQKRKTLNFPLWRGSIFLLLSTLVLLWHGLALRSALERLGEYFLLHPYFSVRHLKVKGTTKIEEVAEIAGIKVGISIWEINLSDVEGQVRKLPWVKKVIARREFPDRIVIELTEHEPKGIVVIRGRPYYTDGEGVIFKQIEAGEKVSYPVITGLTDKDFLSGARSTHQKIHRALRIADIFEKSWLALSQIHFLPDGNVVLYPMAFRVPVLIGDGDWQRKLRRLEQVASSWRGQEDHLASLDLRFNDMVVLSGHPKPANEGHLKTGQR